MHEKNIHGLEKDRYKCHLCKQEKYFSRPSNLRVHLKIFHKSANINLAVRKAEFKKEKKIRDESPLCCHPCKKSIQRKENYEKHIKSYHAHADESKIIRWSENVQNFMFDQKEFELPDEIVHFNMTTSGPIWDFKMIHENVYLVSAELNASFPKCMCTPIDGCGDSCMNRITMVECSSNTCNLSNETCTNRRIQENIVASFERFMTTSKGWGIRATESIKRGEFIMEFVGEVIEEYEYKDRVNSSYKDYLHSYCMHLEGSVVIDALKKGNMCRYVNHSCQPNCKIEKWYIDGFTRIGLFAMRDIAFHEELTFDYNFSPYDPFEQKICKCDSQNCHGFMSSKPKPVKTIQNEFFHSLQLIAKPQNRENELMTEHKTKEKRRYVRNLAMKDSNSKEKKST